MLKVVLIIVLVAVLIIGIAFVWGLMNSEQRTANSAQRTKNSEKRTSSQAEPVLPNGGSWDKEARRSGERAAWIEPFKTLEEVRFPVSFASLEIGRHRCSSTSGSTFHIFE